MDTNENNGPRQSVRRSADIFNTTPDLVREALATNPWACVTGDPQEPVRQFIDVRNKPRERATALPNHDADFFPSGIGCHVMKKHWMRLFLDIVLFFRVFISYASVIDLPDHMA